MASRQARIHFHASHVLTCPIAYDTARGNRRTPWYVALKMRPLLRPCSVHRRGTATSRSLEPLEESIVHR